ncbi:7b5b95ba-d0a0-49c5-afdd-8d11b7609188 [Thermothielavioides terrestris]|uniref:7b5b95ba-d0a0-49c5-afdd-8d11b7609188 n=1 Tax=Thermothielavioides terrestris TaxID=2587410 RepID=A0A3S4CYT1_9PEZI|nr:7b5b95ba-d0a0-49c5-afdd-8d11b7609188 [Thermothielavioides terrestris]
MTAFRRFGALSAEDLLYRQAELVELERSLRAYQQDDKGSGHPDREHYARNWDKLQRSGDSDVDEGNDGLQWETILEIRHKLKEYHEALIRHRQVMELRQPLPSQIKALDEWMRRPSMGNVYLEGPDRKIWSEPNLEDMVTLIPQPPDENFTTEFTVKLVHQYNKLLGRHIHKEETGDLLQNAVRYRDEGIFRVLKILTTLVASLLPVGGIAVLYTIQSMPGRLAATAAFTALFSFSLSLITTASTKDIFSATAAFAAVLVVFVGTTQPA